MVYQGRKQGFQMRGGAKYVHVAHIPTAKRQVLYGRGPAGARLRAPGSSSVLEALSWYLSLILVHSDTKKEEKNPTVDQNLEGARACCTPLWIRHCV